MSWLNGWTLETLMSVLPVGTLTTGVMPTDVHLEKLKTEAEVDLPGPELEEVAETVYTDGSAIDPSDPLLRRAAWAVTWPTPTGWKTVSGPCPGAQKVGRAELRAALWAAEAAKGHVLIISDCKYVVDGVNTMRVGVADHLLNGPDSDLWERMAKVLPKIRWVPAHKTLAQAREQGIRLDDWAGNKRADIAAAEAAHKLTVPGAVKRR